MASSPLSLVGKTELVTGGNCSLSRTEAFSLARVGARVAIVGCNKEINARTLEEAERAGFERLPIQVDLTEGAQIERIATEAITRLGRVDVLVNNTGACYTAPPSISPTLSATPWPSTSRRMCGLRRSVQHLG